MTNPRHAFTFNRLRYEYQNDLFEMLYVKVKILNGQLQPGGVRIESIATAKPVVS